MHRADSFSFFLGRRVGRWRAKELFPEGRRTCQVSFASASTRLDGDTDLGALASQLSHVRMGTLNDMT